MKKVCTEDIINRLQAHDWTVLGRAISIVENNEDGWETLLDYAYQAAREDCFIIGLTGAGGAGKSTLTDKLIKAFRQAKKTVGVIAVDPSSPFTGGAVLGDRVRMGLHNRDTNVFIRSFGSRGTLGGISRGAKDVLYLYKAFGFDVIIIESVGAGQAETDIAHYVDVTAVVLAPGNGDSIQMSKAGTQEIADVFVVNKADRPDAEVLKQNLLATFEAIPKNRRPTVVMTIASEGKGIDELITHLEEAKERLIPGSLSKKQARIENEMFSGAMREFETELLEKIRAMSGDVLAGKTTPFAAASALGKRIHITEAQ